MLMKRFLLFITVLSLTALGWVSSDPAAAQVSVNPTVTCIPVQQFSQNQTQLECRMRTPETPYFLVAEVQFPFEVSKVIKVTSTFAAAFGQLYPTQLVDNTIVFASLDWGNQDVNARLQAIPFDSLSFFVETQQSMATVKQAMNTADTEIALLSPNPSNPNNPFYQEISVADNLLFDGSLFLESFTQYVSPGVLQFLRLGVACYEQSAQACLTNLIQQL